MAPTHRRARRASALLCPPSPLFLVGRGPGGGSGQGPGPPFRPPEFSGGAFPAPFPWLPSYQYLACILVVAVAAPLRGPAAGHESATPPLWPALPRPACLRLCGTGPLPPCSTAPGAPRICFPPSRRGAARPHGFGPASCCAASPGPDAPACHSVLSMPTSLTLVAVDAATVEPAKTALLSARHLRPASLRRKEMPASLRR